MGVTFIITGAGGHGRVVADLIRGRDGVIRGFVDSDGSLGGLHIDGIPVLGDDAWLESARQQEIVLANGLGAADSLTPRTQLFLRLKAAGFVFPPLIHSGALMSGTAVVGAGAQVMAGAVVQAGSVVAENTIINTRAVVDHDCRIGAHAHVAPGATLCGNVEIGDGGYVGAGSIIIQGIRVGAGAFIAAGAVVVADVAAGACVSGVPAKAMRR